VSTPFTVESDDELLQDTLRKRVFLFSIASLEMTATFMVRTEGTFISFEASMITGDSSSGLDQYMILLTYLGVSCVVH
jgi:hypothetical protein